MLAMKITNHDIPIPVARVCERLEFHGHQAWVVGGCVRDTMLERCPNDWDVATDATPQEVIECFHRVLPTGIEHGTVTVLIEGAALAFPVEVTTFRGDGDYSDGRRPDSVQFVKTIKEDLARRDFTINAMAFRPITEEFADPFDGQRDLRNKIIKCVGDAKTRFNEDGLRIMRAARFAAQLNFNIDSKTWDAIPTGLEKFKMVAKERITTEFVKLLKAQHPMSGLRTMRDRGLLAAIFPMLDPPSDFAMKNVCDMEGMELRIASLLFPMAAGVNSFPVREALNGLRLPTAESMEVVALVNGFWSVPGGSGCVSEADARRWVSKVGRERYKAVLAMARVFGNSPDFTARIEFAMETATALSVSELALNGDQVAEILGVKPGKRIGEALRFLLDKVLEKPELNVSHRLTKILLTQFTK
jgi:tRNA nucleotidyltransferase (CCA-adding enzyme)